MAKVNCPQCAGTGKISEGPEGKCGNCYGTGKVEATTTSSTGGGSNGCFGGETQILTPFGWRDLAHIQQGDLVISVEPNKALKARCVRRVSQHKNIRLICIICREADHSFSCTSQHPILTQRGWVRAGSLKSGDQLSVFNSHGDAGLSQVTNVVDTGRTDSAYNLIVAGSYNYIVGGGVASSFVAFRRTRTLFFRTIDAYSKTKDTTEAVLSNSRTGPLVRL
jgi:hypothetical protein